MRCRLCGGILKYENGLYLCSHCGTKQLVPSVFENTEVCICYVENDSQGRRSRDSVIAQDVYNKLQNAKINTFYQRVSVADLSGDDIKAAYQSAFSQAKVVILCATSKENFITLLDENKEKMANKKIIPIYSSVSVNNMPEAIRKLQGVNYDNIGAVNDLLKNILHILGKQNEVVYNEKKLLSKKGKHLIVILLSILLALVFAFAYILFNTPYILKYKKYGYAQQLMSSGNFTAAIDYFSRLGNYKNSKDILKSIYDKYEGYYYDENSSSTLHITIENLYQAKIEYDKKEENSIIKFSEKGELRDEEIVVNFNDNFDNEGVAVVKLNNDSIDFTIEGKDNIKIKFDVKEKSDAPIEEGIKKSTIINWLKSNTSISDIETMGYEVEYLEPLGSEEGIFRRYQISNTDIYLITSAYDATKEGFSTFVWNDETYSNPFVMAIEGTADLLCPDKIGQNDNSFTNDGVKYYPNGISYNDNIVNKITMDTPIIITSDKLLQENEFILPERWFYESNPTYQN